jgi:DNA mismatch repair protein MutS2
MIYPANFEQKIGFDQIRERVAAHCLSALGKERVEAMTFSADYEALCEELGLTGEFAAILGGEDAFPAEHYHDVRAALKKIRVEGAYLTEREAFDLWRSLETIGAIRRFFRRRREGGGGTSLRLEALAEEVPDFTLITKELATLIDTEGKLRDGASVALGDIRKRLAQTAEGIVRLLNRILRQAQAEGWVEKGVAPSVRDGRLMIPVAAGLKRKLGGIVHDESASGKTVFVEPAEVVEANNRIRELENEEKREAVRILTAFSLRLRPELGELRLAYGFLATMDFVRAKALFALEIGAILPVVEPRPVIDWVGAVHPLLAMSHRRLGKSVVPLDLPLVREGTPDDGGMILVVSGPNAGGKSVLLKTTGLLQYMLQSGLLIPLGERSRTGVFSDIFLDIGDEQSIENDLSTYSSHLTNMKQMLKYASARSLILIDEFGSGTEPQIGGAIAEALLLRFREKGCFGIVTTHYQNLKTCADACTGIVNGAMLYDRQEMQALFKLSVGQPGASFAIEIARKIGLPEDVIAEASEKVGKDYVAMDKYLQDIVRDKRYWETKRQQIRQQEKQLEALAEQYQTGLATVEKERKEILRQAQTDAEHLLTDANAQIERTIREIREAQAEKERTRAARKVLDSFRQSLQQAPGTTTIPDQSHPLKKAIKKRRTQEPTDQGRSDANRKKEIRAGDAVRIRGQQTAGEVLEVKGTNVVVAFGSIKTSTKLDRLEKVSNSLLKPAKGSAQPHAANHADFLLDKKLHFKPELDVRGMRGDEALQSVIYCIDDAIQCNAGRVRILHGTGTGALRQLIRDYLKTFPGIRHFRDEHAQLGGTGITVVDLE